MDLSYLGGSRAAERWWGHHTQRALKRAPPPDIAKGWGFSVCLHPPSVSLFGPVLLTAMSERG